MANYPKFPSLPFMDIQDLQNTLIRWANELERELDAEDIRQTTAPATNINTVTTVTELGRPNPGDIAYSISAAKFRGYTTTATGWVDFH